MGEAGDGIENRGSEVARLSPFESSRVIASVDYRTPSTRYKSDNSLENE